MVRWFYVSALFFLTLTGFGQMPVFKRYYIADIPGLGWLAKFFVTHYLHYLVAVAFIAFVVYAVFDFFSLSGKDLKITVSGYLRGFMMAGILISGLLLVVRNLEGTLFSPGLIIFLDLAHLGLVMSFLATALACGVLKKKWTTPC